MKIWVTEIGEPPPIDRSFRLLRYGNLTQEFAKEGHQITWWASSFNHSSKSHVRNTDTVEKHSGVTLRIIKGPGYRKNISLQRVRHQAHFAKRFYDEASRLEAPDVLVTTVPALEIAEAAIQYGKKFGVPVVVDVRDEWPDEFADLAPPPLRSIAKLFLWEYYRKAKFIFQNADGIIGISQRKLNYGLSFAKRERKWTDAVVPLGYPLSPMSPHETEKAKASWLEMGIDPSSFICCYFGTMGNFFDIGTVIKAAKVLSGKGNFQFVLGGYGSKLEYFKKLACDQKNIFFPGWVNATQINALMQMSKVGLAPYRVGARMSLPNKPFEYFAGGLPVVSSLEGELEDILVHNQVGVNYRADSVEQLVECLLNLYENQDQAKQMGANARKLLEERYTTEFISREMVTHLATIREGYDNSITKLMPTELAPVWS